MVCEQLGAVGVTVLKVPGAPLPTLALILEGSDEGPFLACSFRSLGEQEKSWVKERLGTQNLITSWGW